MSLSRSSFHVLLFVLANLVTRGTCGQTGFGSDDSLGNPDRMLEAKKAYETRLAPLEERVRLAGAYQDSMLRVFEHAMTTEHLFRERTKIDRYAPRSGKLRNRLIDSIRKAGTSYIVRELKFLEKEQAMARQFESERATKERNMIRMEQDPKSVGQLYRGTTLNHLLDMINTLGIEGSLVSLQEIPLEESVAKDIRLMLGTPSNAITAPLLQVEGSLLTWDPHPALLRTDLKPLIEEYALERTKLVAALNEGHLPAEGDVARADEALDRITQKLLELKPERIHSNTDPEYVTFQEGHRFVKEQSHQVAFLASGEVKRKPFAGQTIQSLILYMNLYGYRFAPAPRQHEHSYKVLYEGMHDVFVKLRADRRGQAISVPQMSSAPSFLSTSLTPTSR